MRIYCKIEGAFKGYRELQSFNQVIQENWSEGALTFPMFDLETSEIFECGFNRLQGELVAYREVTMQEFRERASKMAEKVLQRAIEEAIKKASSDASSIYAEIQTIEALKTLTVKRE